MQYDKDFHSSRHHEIVSLGAIERRERGSVRRLRPRGVLLCWILVGFVPWAVIAAFAYRW